jgi:tetratricopeptide (TPR) repeat protein
MLKPPRSLDASRHYTAALALRPKSAALYVNLGAALLSAGKRDEALAALEKAVSLEPGLAVAHNNLGSALARIGRRDEALTAYREAIRLKPDLYEVHVNRGNVLRDEGQLDEAIKAYRKAIREASHRGRDFPAAHAALADALKRKGRPDEAILAYKKFLLLKPNSAEAHANLGLILLGRGRLGEAIAECETAIALKPNLAEAINTLAGARRGRGQLDEAFAAFRQAVRLKPNLAIVHCNFGLVLGEAGRTDEAIAALRQALYLQPDLAEAHCGLGLQLHEKGRFGEALAALRRGDELGRKRPSWPFPSALWVKACLHLMRLEPKWPAALRGEVKFTAVEDLLALARISIARGQDRAAAAFYQGAFKASPVLAGAIESRHRFHAARAAARASLAEEDSAAWRRQALAWLRADLVLWQKHLAQKSEQARGKARLHLRRWQRERDFAGLREPSALARLPESEREAWGAFWAAVARAVEGHRERTGPDEKVAHPDP